MIWVHLQWEGLTDFIGVFKGTTIVFCADLVLIGHENGKFPFSFNYRNFIFVDLKSVGV